jgi:ADP-ribose pyrophosphatase YjhB (NUDIX family)
MFAHHPFTERSGAIVGLGRIGDLAIERDGRNAAIPLAGRAALVHFRHAAGHRLLGVFMALHHRLLGKAARIVWKVTRPRTIGVRAVLLDRDDRVALVRHTYIDQWYLPGGGVKKGESVEAALLRELEEEVAISRPAIERILGVYHSRGEGKDDHIVIYVARTPHGSADGLKRNETAEIAQAGWFALDGLPTTTSPATLRRIAEYRQGVLGGGTW